MIRDLAVTVLWQAVPKFPDSLPLAIFTADTEGRVRYRLPLVTYINLFKPVPETIWMSPQVEALTGYEPAEWMETPGFFASILHPDDRESVLEEVRLSRVELRPFSRDYRLIARSGETVWVQDESVPVLDARGRPEFIQGYFVDLTERKALEQQLLQSQKTEAVGRMAAGIAHDFNNHLTAIRGYADLLRLELPEHSRAQRDVSDIVDTTVRAKMLIEQLLAFCRKEPLEPRAIDLHQVVGELKSMLTQVAGRRIAVRFDLAVTPLVHADPGQLEQVIVNLVTNARDAMIAGGIVTIATGLGTVLEGTESNRLGIDPGSYAVLTVSDVGGGIEPEVLGSIFDPFFTTKERDAGTGLGLMTVNGIVRKFRGAIDVASVPGKGSTFRVLLPAMR
jgi:two-component system, cell cycle sensor histidine kinase and response regulator CckA